MAPPLHSWLSSVVTAGRTLTQGLVHILYPNTCWICGQHVGGEQTGFCAPCRHALTTDPHSTCPRCSRSVGPYVNRDGACNSCRDESYGFDQVVRMGPYEGLLRDVMPILKRWSGEGLAEMMGELWATHAEARLRALSPDVIIPVPLHWWRHVQRGYNQSQALARALAAHLRLPCRARWLRRIRPTPHQTFTAASARRQNLRGAFRVRPGLVLEGKTVLLVDDVLTTGSTASEAARALRSARPARIIVAVLASPSFKK